MILQSWNYSNRKSRLVFAISVAYLSAGFILMNRTLVVVPTYNERENLPPLARRILALPAAVDLLVVDDNSPDGTGKIADQLASEFPSIHVLHRTEKAGLGRAYIAGFHGHSKMSGHIVREAFFMVWRLWLQNKMRRRPTGTPPGNAPEMRPPSVPPATDQTASKDNRRAPDRAADRAATSER